MSLGSGCLKLKFGLSALISVFFIVGLASCSDDAAGSLKWDVHEEQQFKPIRQGAYKVEFIIHQDECEPSLKELIASQVEWPPKEQMVSFDVSADYPHDILSPPVMFLYGVEVRTGRQYSVVERLSVDFARYSLKGMNPVNGWDHGIVQGGCFVEQFPSELIEWYFSDFNSEITTKIEEDGTIQIDTETIWNGMKECPGFFQDYNYLLPKSPCKESYSFRYVLKQACEPVDSCRVSGGWISANTGTLEVTYATTPIACECKG